VNRAWVKRAALAATAREQITVALALIDALAVQLAAIDRQLCAHARRQAGCRALMAHYGIGALVSVVIRAELGDCRRFSLLARGGPLRGPGHHRAPVRPAPRAGAPLAPGATGTALGTVAQHARRTTSPDRAYDKQAAERLGGNRACLAVARRLLKRS
jgi:hypothetical protein